MKKASGAAKWGREKTRNGGSRNGSSADRFRAIEELLEAKQWSAAKAAIQEAFVFHPGDHWLWMHLGLCYYEQQDYEKALKCSEHAVQLEPDCPLAMWHYAGSLAMAGRMSGALTIWTALLSLDVETIAFGEHGEGMDWALQLVNDVHFRMGRAYQALGENTLAQQSFAKYLHNRAHGVASLYETAVAQRCVRELEDGPSKSAKTA